jgi:hypothetical protein
VKKLPIGGVAAAAAADAAPADVVGDAVRAVAAAEAAAGPGAVAVGANSERFLGKVRRMAEPCGRTPIRVVRNRAVLFVAWGEYRSRAADLHAVRFGLVTGECSESACWSASGDWSNE